MSKKIHSKIAKVIQEICDSENIKITSIFVDWVIDGPLTGRLTASSYKNLVGKISINSESGGNL